MKNITLFVGLLFTFSLFSCSSPEEKLIKNHIHAYLPDVKSYESIELSDSKPYLSRMDENIKLASLRYELDSLIKTEKHKRSDVSYLEKMNFNDKQYGKMWGEWYNAAAVEWMQVNRDIRTAKYQIDSITSNYTPVQLGYEFLHKFRAKNNSGGYALEEFYFVTDMERLKLIKVYPVASNENTDFPSLIYYDALSLGI